jgi:hypothetical protein
MLGFFACAKELAVEAAKIIATITALITFVLIVANLVFMFAFFRIETRGN